MTDINSTLQERGSRYGTMLSNGETAQSLKLILRSHKNWPTLTPDKRESLEMIMHKIARILNGDPEYADNWLDIEGYSKLIRETLDG